MNGEFRFKEIYRSENKDITEKTKNTQSDLNGEQELNEAKNKVKLIIKYYCENDKVEAPIKPMERIYAQNWERIKLKKSIEANLKDCNPNYALGREWRVNCQRCVPTYEMRKRGYDVTTLPKPREAGITDLACSPFSVWKNPDVISCRGNGMEDIEKKMQEWGDGTRAQVVVVWKNTNVGHTFVAERVNGKTVYIDPQNGSIDVSKYFTHVEEGTVKICRTDTLDVTHRILECCRKV